MWTVPEFPFQGPKELHIFHIAGICPVRNRGEFHHISNCSLQSDGRYKLRSDGEVGASADCTYLGDGNGVVFCNAHKEVLSDFMDQYQKDPDQLLFKSINDQEDFLVKKVTSYCESDEYKSVGMPLNTTHFLAPSLDHQDSSQKPDGSSAYEQNNCLSAFFH